MRWIISAEALRAVPCPVCADGFAASGLTDAERKLTFDDIQVDLPGDANRKMFAFKWAAGRLVTLGYGFAAVYGNYGTGKSLMGKIIVAEACRRRLRAKYLIGKKLEERLFRRDEENRLATSEIDLAAIRKFPILVIDECQMMNWRNDWVAGELMSLIEDRYRGASDQNMLTILISQTHPSRWGPEGNVGALFSRSVAGSFALPWPALEPAPPCLLERPCISCNSVMRAQGNLVVCAQCGSSRDIEMYWPFALDLADVRPILPPLAGAEALEDEATAAFATFVANAAVE